MALNGVKSRMWGNWGVERNLLSKIHLKYFRFKSWNSYCKCPNWSFFIKIPSQLCLQQEHVTTKNHIDCTSMTSFHRLLFHFTSNYSSSVVLSRVNRSKSIQFLHNFRAFSQMSECWQSFAFVDEFNLDFLFAATVGFWFHDEIELFLDLSI